MWMGKDAKASYKHELSIEKPGRNKEHSPSPVSHEEVSDDETMQAALSYLQEFRKKPKLSIN